MLSPTALYEYATDTRRVADPRNAPPSYKTPASTAVIYVRTGSGAPQDRHETHVQQYECRQRCKQLDAVVQREFIDRGLSGATLDRPGLQSMLRYLSTNSVDYVVTQDSLRISRRLDQQGLVLDELRSHGVKLVTAEDVRPAGRFDQGRGARESNNLLTPFHGRHQPLQRVIHRRIVRHYLRGPSFVVRRLAQRSGQELDLLLLHNRQVRRLMTLARLHRQEHDVPLSGQRGKRSSRRHSPLGVRAEDSATRFRRCDRTKGFSGVDR